MPAVDSFKKMSVAKCTVLFGKANVVLVNFRSKTSERKICKYWILVAALCRTW